MLIPLLTVLCLLLAASLVVGVVLTSRERKMAHARATSAREGFEEALAQVESDRDNLLNSLSDPFFLVDATGVIRFANKPAERLFENRVLTNRKLDEVFLDRRLSAPIREVLDEKVPVTTHVFLSQQASPFGGDERPGETAWLVDASPVDSEVSAGLVRVIIRDTTAEHHAEQVRKDFVANASHELRTPLAIINGYLENLIDESMLDDQRTSLRFLKIMRKHGQRITRIVEDMLIISRLESGEAGSLKVKPFRLEACVQDVLERLESVVTSQGAKVTLAMGNPALRLLGDRFYWTQVLFNLVENALKQNPDIPLNIEVGWEETPRALKMWVSDDGVGIPSADLPFIFRRFYRVEKHHSQKEIKGTGLGLSIVRRAIEAHGGDIEVTSTPGRQTRFEITLSRKAISKEDGGGNAPGAEVSAEPGAARPGP